MLDIVLTLSLIQESY